MRFHKNFIFGKLLKKVSTKEELCIGLSENIKNSSISVFTNREKQFKSVQCMQSQNLFIYRKLHSCILDNANLPYWCFMWVGFLCPNNLMLLNLSKYFRNCRL